MQRFDGKVVIITGAASGIGRALVDAFLAEGARVVAADLDASALAEACDGAGARCTVIQVDIEKDSSWKVLFEKVRSELGRVDVLVNNAGVLLPADIESVGSEDFMQTMAVNALGPTLGCRYAIAEMRQSGGGAIVNIASTTAVRSESWTTAYSASKAAVVNMTRTTALHCARNGYQIRVNAVLPGVVHTPMVQRLLDQAPDPQAALDGLKALHPIGRLLQPEEIAPAVLLLASDEASGMTGSCVCVDGGLTVA